MSGRTYRFFQGEPQYEFGYGLSYTKFSYSDLRIDQEKEVLSVDLTLTNTGLKDGDEVVQLYVKEETQRKKMPLKSLKGFQRVFLAAGDGKKVHFVVPYRELRHWDVSRHKFIPGEAFYEIQIGASSNDIRLKQQIEIRGIAQ